MFYLAPLQALTDLAYRKAFSSVFENSFDFAVSPFISLTHGDLSPSYKKLREIFPETNKNTIPLIPQILGREAAEFVALANAIHKLGYAEVNWNLGCPMPQVTRKKRGSGLLPYPDEIKQILDIVVPNIKPKLSIKIRLGLESEKEFSALIPILNAYPLANICIHPRTAAQLYGGSLHLNILEEYLAKLKHKIIFNGDIVSNEDFEIIQNRFPVIHDFMIGRGVLRNPFLLEEIKGLDSGNRVERFLLFHTNLMHEVSEKLHTGKGCLNKMKEYWSYFATQFSNPDETFKQISQTQSISEFQALSQSLIIECYSK